MEGGGAARGAARWLLAACGAMAPHLSLNEIMAWRRRGAGDGVDDSIAAHRRLNIKIAIARAWRREMKKMK